MTDHQPWFQRDEHRRDVETAVAEIIRTAYEAQMPTPNGDACFESIAAREIFELLFQESAPVFQASQNHAEMLPKREPAGSGADTTASSRNKPAPVDPYWHNDTGGEW
ncbi:hypothetical protein KUL72_20975 [Bradyrhizobium arachidis]|uniref:hypothetical protein n=1 Tax=Bradyrhizobium arachidis TaxID=858423 RepID=UPI002162FC27|nr:hypothetical protein [Bradyrhizobium arachidis]UVO33988.1 hypothetical protein KUL72_20975 [Bradyrhizobium arachidis]